MAVSVITKESGAGSTNSLANISVIRVIKRVLCSMDVRVTWEN